MVQNKQKGGTGVEIPPPRSFSGGVSSCLYLMILMCARCVCTYVSSALLQKRPMIIHMFIVCSCLCLMVHMYRHVYVWWYICVLAVSVRVYHQAPCVCTYVSSALLPKRPMIIHMFIVCSCLCLMVHMCRHQARLMIHLYHQLFCKRDLWWYICTIRHKHEHTSNKCIIIGLFCKRAGDTYVQTQRAHICIIRHMYAHQARMMMHMYTHIPLSIT